MQKKIIKLSVSILKIFLFITVLLFLSRDFLINNLAFFPTKELKVLPNFTYLSEVSVKTNDGVKLYGYKFSHEKKTKKVLIFFHGNAGNGSDRIAQANESYKMGVDVILV